MFSDLEYNESRPPPPPIRYTSNLHKDVTSCRVLDLKPLPREPCDQMDRLSLQNSSSGKKDKKEKNKNNKRENSQISKLTLQNYFEYKYLR